MNNSSTEQIAFGTCSCGAAGQLFRTGKCAHCYIAELLEQLAADWGQRPAGKATVLEIADALRTSAPAASNGEVIAFVEHCIARFEHGPGANPNDGLLHDARAVLAKLNDSRRRLCDCDPHRGPCQLGLQRFLLSCELSRCLIPASGHIKAQLAPAPSSAAEEKRARMEVQNKEFAAVAELAEQYRRITLTPIVDDDYPEVRHRYESAVRDVIKAFRENGRMEKP